MMFDPPDYPYKDLSETLRENYGPDDLLFTNVNNDRVDNFSLSNNELVTVTEQMISNVESELLYHSNDCGRYFNVENTTYFDTNNNNTSKNEANGQLYYVQSENLLNYEPTLLDDNTVNQFLLPLQNSSDKSQVILEKFNRNDQFVDNVLSKVHITTLLIYRKPADQIY